MLVSFAADVDVMDVGSFLFVGGDRDRGGYGRLGHLLHFYVPLVLGLFQIAQSELGLAVRDQKVDSVFAKNSVNFGDHLVGIGSGIFSALWIDRWLPKLSLEWLCR